MWIRVCLLRGSYACSYCNHTLYPQAAGEFCGHFNEVALRFLQIPAATGYLLICFLFVLIFPAYAGPLRAVCRRRDLLAPGTAAPKGRSPSLDAHTSTVLPAEGNEPSGRPPLKRRPPEPPGSFPADHAPTHNEHRVTGYRTLAALASDSPPRASVIASRVPRPGAPRPAETGRDRARRAARPRDRNPPAESCTRFAPPLFSFWQPQRAVKGRIARVAHGGVLVGFPP